MTKKTDSVICEFVKAFIDDVNRDRVNVKETTGGYGTFVSYTTTWRGRRFMFRPVAELLLDGVRIEGGDSRIRGSISSFVVEAFGAIEDSLRRQFAERQRQSEVKRRQTGLLQARRHQQALRNLAAKISGNR